MIVGTKGEFENLAEFILRDYLGDQYEIYQPFDIQAFAKNYLKLGISYCVFNLEDNIAGMRAGNQIILDARLMDDNRIGERNFTIAHECGHDLINWQDPSYVPYATTNYRIRHHHKELKTEDDFKEWQANVVASCLLLRPNLVDWTLCTFTQKDKLPVFGDYTFYRQDKLNLRMMSEFLGVSQSCLFYRLERLEMLDRKPLDEYDPMMNIRIGWEVF